MGTVIRGGDSGADQAPTGETVGGCADGWGVRSERKSEAQTPASVWPGRPEGGAAADRDACLMYQFSIAALTNLHKLSGRNTSVSYLPLLEAEA